MFRWSQRFVRQLGFDVFYDDEDEGEATEALQNGLLFSAVAIQARRRLVLAASWAAHAALAERSTADRNAVLGFASPSTAEMAFRAAVGADVRLEMVLAAFTPTVVLYPDNGPSETPRAQWWRDGVPPHEFGKGIVQIGPIAGQVRVRGEAFLMPPALRGEGRRRGDWVRGSDLDPPRNRDEAGPFWSLGETELWRLDLLGWHEQLVLAAAVGTRMSVAAVVSEPNAFPRIGYVVETARERGLTLVHVPFSAVPAGLLEVLEATRGVRSTVEQGLVTADAAPEAPEPELWE